MKPKQQTKQPSISLSRPRIERMQGIQEYIATHKYPNAKELAAHFEVGVKVIYKDVSFLQDRMHDPIDFDYRKNGYYYTGKRVPLLCPQATEQEIEALHLLEAACKLLEGISRANPARSTLKKVIETMSKSMPETKGWKSVVSFHTTQQQIFDPQLFDEIFTAAVHRKEVKVLYRKVGQNSQIEERLLEPHHISKVDGEWFIFARDPDNHKMRTFIPARLKSVARTGKKFKRSKDFCIEERLRHSFHIVAGDGMYDVHIEFNEHVADYIREKKWRGQQAQRELDNGSLDLHLRLSSLVEIQRWILNWGGNAIPTAPLELEETVVAAARKIVENYERRRATNSAQTQK